MGQISQVASTCETNLSCQHNVYLQIKLYLSGNCRGSRGGVGSAGGEGRGAEGQGEGGKGQQEGVSVNTRLCGVYRLIRRVVNKILQRKKVRLTCLEISLHHFCY